jgi:hypothetical protein
VKAENRAAAACFGRSVKAAHHEAAETAELVGTGPFSFVIQQIKEMLESTCGKERCFGIIDADLRVARDASGARAKADAVRRKFEREGDTKD